MNEVLNLPAEIQVIFVSGYFFYLIIRAGSRYEPRIEHLIFITLVSGTISVNFGAFLVEFSRLQIDLINIQIKSDTYYFFYLSIFSIITSILIGLIWKRFLKDISVKSLNRLGGYKDDHYKSTMESILANPATWTVIHVSTKDGRVLEADYAKVREKMLPSKPLLVHEDGIATYFTSITNSDGEITDFPTDFGNYGAQITFVPFSEIGQIDILWKK